MSYNEDYYQSVDTMFNSIKVSPFKQPLIDPTAYEMPGQIVPAAWVQNADPTLKTATVVIDSTGITITNGKLTLNDQFGTNVISGAGFGASWLDFIAAGVYNDHFGVGTVFNITAPTIVGTAGTEADYDASLSTDLPYWGISIRNASGTMRRVVNATAVGGYALWFKGYSLDAEIFQDVPVLPTTKYDIHLNWRYDTHTGGSFTKTVSYQFLDSTHAPMGSKLASGLAFTDINNTYHREWQAATTTSFANARYMRIWFQITNDAAGGLTSPDVFINTISVAPSFERLLASSDLGLNYLVGTSAKTLVANTEAEFNAQFRLTYTNPHPFRNARVRWTCVFSGYLNGTTTDLRFSLIDTLANRVVLIRTGQAAVNSFVTVNLTGIQTVAAGAARTMRLTVLATAAFTLTPYGGFNYASQMMYELVGYDT